VAGEIGKGWPLQLMQEHPRPWIETLEKAAVERKL
jgi:hypothetical protein